MNALVKILVDDDGQRITNGYWHLVDPGNLMGRATLCTGEFFGSGESAVEFECKAVARGGVTCPQCLDKLRVYKSVRM